MKRILIALMCVAAASPMPPQAPAFPPVVTMPGEELPMVPVPKVILGNDGKAITAPARAAVANPTPNAFILSWGISPNYRDGTVFAIFSKGRLTDTNWYPVGATTNFTCTISMRRASGLPLTSIFFCVDAYEP